MGLARARRPAGGGHPGSAHTPTSASPNGARPGWYQGMQTCAGSSAAHVASAEASSTLQIAEQQPTELAQSLNAAAPTHTRPSSHAEMYSHASP
jgi:hypothetical protein